MIRSAHAEFQSIHWFGNHNYGKAIDKTMATYLNVWRSLRMENSALRSATCCWQWFAWRRIVAARRDVLRQSSKNFATMDLRKHECRGISKQPRIPQKHTERVQETRSLRYSMQVTPNAKKLMDMPEQQHLYTSMYDEPYCTMQVCRIQGNITRNTDLSC